MTNLITLTIPNDDHVALRAFGKALEEMALAHGASPTQLQVVNEITMSEEQSEALRERLKEVLGEPEVDTTAQQVESLSERKPIIPNFGTYPGQPVKLDDDVIGNVSDTALRDAMVTAHVEITSPKAVAMVTGADKTGTQWDERIHSASKALNADGTWRLRRKPKDMDETMWLKYIESVKNNTADDNDDSWDTDCRPGSGGEGGVGVGEFDEEYEAVSIEPPVTPPGDDFHTDAGVVTEQTVAGIPPIPVPPSATGAMLDALAAIPVAPPLPHTIRASVSDEQAWDFPKLMKFLTERHGKIDVPTVNQLLAVDGLAALTDLNAHPDKIGPFVARVKAHLGE